MTNLASERAPAAPQIVRLRDWIPAAWRTVRTDLRLLLRGLIGLLSKTRVGRLHRRVTTGWQAAEEKAEVAVLPEWSGQHRVSGVC